MRGCRRGDRSDWDKTPFTLISAMVLYAQRFGHQTGRVAPSKPAELRQYDIIVEHVPHRRDGFALVALTIRTVALHSQTIVRAQWRTASDGFGLRVPGRGCFRSQSQSYASFKAAHFISPGQRPWLMPQP
jgi:hypothetical protein